MRIVLRGIQRNVHKIPIDNSFESSPRLQAHAKPVNISQENSCEKTDEADGHFVGAGVPEDCGQTTEESNLNQIIWPESAVVPPDVHRGTALDRQLLQKDFVDASLRIHAGLRAREQFSFYSWDYDIPYHLTPRTSRSGRRGPGPVASGASIRTAPSRRGGRRFPRIRSSRRSGSCPRR